MTTFNTRMIFDKGTPVPQFYDPSIDNGDGSFGAFVAITPSTPLPVEVTGGSADLSVLIVQDSLNNQYIRRELIDDGVITITYENFDGTQASPVAPISLVSPALPPNAATATKQDELKGVQGTGSSYDPPVGGSGVLGYLSGVLKQTLLSATEATLLALSAKFPASLGAKASAASLSVVRAVGGVFASQATRASATAIVQTDTAYAAGDCIGTIMEFAGFLDSNVNTGTLNSIGFSFDSAQTQVVDAYVFNDTLSGSSTVTDSAPFVLAAGDLSKQCGVFQVPVASVLGASGATTHYYAGNLGQAITGTTNGKVYVVLVAEVAMTLTASDLLAVRLAGTKD